MRVPGMAAELSGTRLRTLARSLEDLARTAGGKGWLTWRWTATRRAR